MTKTVAKLLIEEIFSVNVVSINSCIFPAKKRRLGKYLGVESSFKKIFVKLNTGQFIPFFQRV